MPTRPPSSDADPRSDADLETLDIEVLAEYAALCDLAAQVHELMPPPEPPSQAEIAAAVERMPEPDPEVAEILRQHAADRPRTDPAELLRLRDEGLAAIANFPRNEARRARRILAARRPSQLCPTPSRHARARRPRSRRARRVAASRDGPDGEGEPDGDHAGGRRPDVEPKRRRRA